MVDRQFVLTARLENPKSEASAHLAVDASAPGQPASIAMILKPCPSITARVMRLNLFQSRKTHAEVCHLARNLLCTFSPSLSCIIILTFGKGSFGGGQFRYRREPKEPIAILLVRKAFSGALPCPMQRKSGSML
ncbi:MAG: hypothetical protein E5V65_04815 [Mesorhizobium sp.]|nr:MAG: hypothetical protein E5V65_04815 [Mesorhizobium sp.]